MLHRLSVDVERRAAIPERPQAHSKRLRLVGVGWKEELAGHSRDQQRARIAKLMCVAGARSPAPQGVHRAGIRPEVKEW